MRRPLSVTRFMFAVLLLALALCLGACGGGERETSKKDDMDDLGPHEVIYDGVDQVLEDYLDEDGYLEPDMDVVEEAALAVYDYALELEEAGTIEGAAYCEAGYSVSFFNNDGTTTVYLPPLRDYYSGAGEFSVAVMSLFTFPDAKSPWYRDPEDTITDAMDNVRVRTYSNDITIEELKEFFGSLDDEDVRAIFWRGHGNVYTNSKGEDLFCICINEKVTDDKHQDYIDDMGGEDESGEKLVEVCDGGTKFAFNHYFIDKYMCNVSGGLFFATTCKSFADGGIMANSFFNKGFDSYVGTSDVINILYASDVMSRTVKYLAQCDDAGAYTDINTALGQAVEDFKGNINQVVNYIDGGGEFVLMNRDESKPFRFRVPAGIEVRLKSSDGSVDLSEVSVQCLKLNPDGTSSPYERLDDVDAGEGGFFIPRDDTRKGVKYQVDISYKFELIKSVTIDPEELDFRSGAASTTIDLRAAYLDVIVTDEVGNFLPDADVQVYATGIGDDLLGLIRQARLTTNENGESVYRLLVTPGEYYVEVTDDKYGSTGGQVLVEGDTTVTFPVVDVHEKLEEHLRNVLVPTFDTPKGLWGARFNMHSEGAPIYVDGIYGVYYGDVDKDRQEELCIFRAKLLPDEFAIGLYLDIYEYKTGEVVLSAEKSFGDATGDNVVALCLSPIGNVGEVSCFVYEYGGETYFLVEFWLMVNHCTRELWLCSYDGENFIDNASDYNHWYGNEVDDITDTPEISAYGISSVLERTDYYDDRSSNPIYIEPKDACQSEKGDLTAIFGIALWNPDVSNTELFEIDIYDYTHIVEDYMYLWTDG